MKIIEFIRLVRKHIVLLILVPLLLAGMQIMMTREPNFVFTSRTTLYTGLATGSTIEMDKGFNYFATNTAFDNLINIINSRETQEEVAIRLLSQHLLLDKADPKYISQKSLDDLKKITPKYIYSYVRKSPFSTAPMPADSTAAAGKSDSTATEEVSVLASHKLFPSSINPLDYERTVMNLTNLMKNSDTNFVYKLLNYQNPHYSIGALSGIKAERIANSDLIRLTYNVDDPGICQQTLAILSEVCINNYKGIKENRSDAVVKYFESQLTMADKKLKEAEDKLLGFNKENNIINYYEQSKAVAVVKEDMEVDYNNKKAQLAGMEAGIKKLEDKLNIQQQVQLKSSALLDKKKMLGDLNYQIASAEADESIAFKVDGLRRQAEYLKGEIKKNVEDIYSYQNTTEGLPVANVLNEWINNVVEAENMKAKLKVMDQRNRDFQQQYSIYAPAGANIKRIEREIAVSEQGYLEILHGLNLAKLKLQDNELAANIKSVDPPYYPISPNPTKRKVMIIAAAFLGAILVLAGILMMEYFDKTLKNLKNASSVLNIPYIGVIPKILLNPGSINLPFVQKRLLELTVQNLEQSPALTARGKETKTILVFSTTEREGKTVVAGNIARHLQETGKRVMMLNYAAAPVPAPKNRRFNIISRLLGYSDPRVNFNSPFLQNPDSYLAAGSYVSYNSDGQYLKASTYTDLTGIQSVKPDYVIIEMPAILHHNYPAELVSHADLCLLVCRSNRIWNDADQKALNAFMSVAPEKTNFIINGVALQEAESVLGELPRKRGVLRRKIKNLFRFQFFSNSEI